MLGSQARKNKSPEYFFQSISPLRWQMQRIYGPPIVINLHCIGDHIFRIEKYAIFRDDVVIIQPHSPIIASSLCGDTFALVLESGDLVIPNRASILTRTEIKFTETAVFGFHMHIFQPHKIKLSASPQSRYVCVRSGESEILVVKHNPETKSIEYVNSTEPSNGRRFQVFEVNGVPYLWSLYTDKSEGIIVLESYNLDPMESLKFLNTPIAKCPIMTISSRNHRGVMKKNLYICASNNCLGVVIHLDDQAFFLGYKRLLVGDLTEGLVRFNQPVQSIIPGSAENNDAPVYISRSSSEMAQIDPEAIGQEIFTGSCMTAFIDETASAYNYNLWSDFAAAISPISNKVTSKVIYANRCAHEIKKISSDNRKWPSKSVTLDKDDNIQTVSLGKHSHEQVSSGIESFQRISYESSLKVSVLSSTNGFNRYLCKQKDLDLPDLRTGEVLLALRFVPKYASVLVYPSVIEIYSAVDPLIRLCTIKTESVGDAGSSILGVAFGSHYCIVHTYDQAVCIDLSTCTQNTEISLTRFNTGCAPISFVCHENDETVIGLDFSLKAYQDEFEATNKITLTDSRYILNSERALGCIAHFKNDGSLNKGYLQSYVPDGWHKFPNGDEVILYGSRKSASRLKSISSQFSTNPDISSSDFVDEDSTFEADDDSSMAILDEKRHNHDSDFDQDITLSEPLTRRTQNTRDFDKIVLDFQTSVQWGDVTSDGLGVVLRGNNLYAISADSCARLVGAEEFYGKTASHITSAVMIDSSIIAYLEKQQLHFISDDTLFADPQPFILSSRHLASQSKAELLFIKSQRVVIRYGTGIAQFLDSLTLKPLDVHGTASFDQKGKVSSLWKFKENETMYEHSIVSGTTEMASYAFQREGAHFNLTSKFRANLSEDFSSSQINPLIIAANGEFVYLTTNSCCNAIRPRDKKVCGEVKLRSPASKISLANDYIVITCKEKIILAKSHDNGRIETVHVISYDKITFVTHVAEVIVDSECRDHILILAQVRENKHRHSSLMGIDYSIEDRKSKFSLASRDIPGHSTVDIKELTTVDAEMSGNARFLRTYALMADQSVCTIDLSPHDLERAQTITIY